MLHARKLNKINRVHEKCLRRVYNGNTSSHDEELLEIDNSVSVHHENIKILATELYKLVNGLSLDIIKNAFPLNNNLLYNTRNRRSFNSRPIRSVTYGSETLSHLVPKILELVPTVLKKWKPRDCPCPLCRTYLLAWLRGLV